uniref:Uncharacterized protein n=1 Tax=Arundo donax TaxID=35708 RepID=A0A0A9AV63_ARUDO
MHACANFRCLYLEIYAICEDSITQQKN